MTNDVPDPDAVSTSAVTAPKKRKDLSGISFEFNSHVNATYKHIHDALNDIYADTLDLTDLEPPFTVATFAMFKTNKC
eukprot:CAMPEP_0201227104 /NCGR_PEP_ID=MMETSP0851-20130426/194961_1 /ASSEMBLY_ACC=CAM_ASM_000631 /TAXON_ID=183588 /ORGANISM="Pseudo-nitzschia fraudulenta, Strain WWA7" /LENGTH=77 /DNA_ID=CAMNT_0047516891 /DNA_START=734 /DNA_END=967 /DNA_ORIENTATION=-